MKYLRPRRLKPELDAWNINHKTNFRFLLTKCILSNKQHWDSQFRVTSKESFKTNLMWTSEETIFEALKMTWPPLPPLPPSGPANSWAKTLAKWIEPSPPFPALKFEVDFKEYKTVSWVAYHIYSPYACYSMLCYVVLTTQIIADRQDSVWHAVNLHISTDLQPFNYNPNQI